jgi:hypothetical protein
MDATALLISGPSRPADSARDSTAAATVPARARRLNGFVSTADHPTV